MKQNATLTYENKDTHYISPNLPELYSYFLILYLNEPLQLSYLIRQLYNDPILRGHKYINLALKIIKTI